MAATHFLVFSTKTDYFLVFFKIPTPDLADYGPEGTWDQLNPVRRTLLYRHFARRAHHLPPDPNILNAKTKKLKNDHFQDSTLRLTTTTSLGRQERSVCGHVPMWRCATHTHTTRRVGGG